MLNDISYYIGFGNGAEEAKDLKSALWAYGEAIRIDPKYAKAYFSRAITFDRLGELDKAIAFV